ncbi:kinase domain protein [Pelomyxa schiedti]|nr:kinase domain protein [Pelomyxa schiedti]
MCDPVIAISHQEQQVQEQAVAKGHQERSDLTHNWESDPDPQPQSPVTKKLRNDSEPLPHPQPPSERPPPITLSQGHDPAEDEEIPATQPRPPRRPQPLDEEDNLSRWGYLPCTPAPVPGATGWTLQSIPQHIGPTPAAPAGGGAADKGEDEDEDEDDGHWEEPGLVQYSGSQAAVRNDRSDYEDRIAEMYRPEPEHEPEPVVQPPKPWCRIDHKTGPGENDRVTVKLITKDCVTFGSGDDMDVVWKNPSVADQHFCLRRLTKWAKEVPQVREGETRCCGLVECYAEMSIAGKQYDLGAEVVVYGKDEIRVEDQCFIYVNFPKKKTIMCGGPLKPRRLLGHGAFAQVWTASCLPLGKEINAVLKVTSIYDFTTHAPPPPEFTIEMESNILHNLTVVHHHPNIPKWIGARKGKKHFFLAMEFIPGRSLKAIVEELEANTKTNTSHKKYLPEFQIRNISTQLFSALRHIHSLGFTHRDVKPENIILRENPEGVHVNEQTPEVHTAYLLDFGFAHETKTMTTRPGTPRYKSPELFGEQHYNEQVDMYSMGAVLYYMFSGGTPPYQNGCTLEIQDHKIEPNFYSDPWPKVSLEAKALLKKLLSVDPAHRPTSTNIFEEPWIKNPLQPVTENEHTAPTKTVQIASGSSSISLSASIVEREAHPKKASQQRAPPASQHQLPPSSQQQPPPPPQIFDLPAFEEGNLLSNIPRQEVHQHSHTKSREQHHHHKVAQQVQGQRPTHHHTQPKAPQKDQIPPSQKHQSKTTRPLEGNIASPQQKDTPCPLPYLQQIQSQKLAAPQTTQVPPLPQTDVIWELDQVEPLTQELPDPPPPPQRDKHARKPNPMHQRKLHPTEPEHPMHQSQWHPTEPEHNLMRQSRRHPTEPAQYSRDPTGTELAFDKRPVADQMLRFRLKMTPRHTIPPHLLTTISGSNKSRHHHHHHRHTPRQSPNHNQPSPQPDIIDDFEDPNRPA